MPQTMGGSVVCQNRQTLIDNPYSCDWFHGLNALAVYRILQGCNRYVYRPAVSSDEHCIL